MSTLIGATYVRRFIATCSFVENEGPGHPIVRCKWNERESPTRHQQEKQAIREAVEHAKEAHHFGAKQVKVKRERQVVSESIVE